jgi:hypothetical protein
VTAAGTPQHGGFLRGSGRRSMRKSVDSLPAGGQVHLDDEAAPAVVAHN